MIEVKDANKSFAMTAAYIGRLFRVAARQGKDAVLMIKFPGYEVECHIKRSRD